MSGPRSLRAVALPRGGDREAFLDAVHAVSHRAWVRVEARDGGLRAVLSPREGRALPARALLDAYERERARRAREARGAALEAAAWSRALDGAVHVDARRRRPAAGLSPDRVAEIRRLLAEDGEARVARAASSVAAPWDRRRREPERR